MSRKNKRRVGASKKGRKHRKAALRAGLGRRVGHPSGKFYWKRWHWVEPGKRRVLSSDKRGSVR